MAVFEAFYVQYGLVQGQTHFIEYCMTTSPPISKRLCYLIGCKRTLTSYRVVLLLRMSKQ